MLALGVGLFLNQSKWNLKCDPKIDTKFKAKLYTQIV